MIYIYNPSFNSHNNLLRQILLSSTFTDVEIEAERLNDLPEVTNKW